MNLFSSYSLRRLLTSTSFCSLNQLKEMSSGLFITFLFVSCRYFSIFSSSPENHASRRPPLLISLVLILFDEGDVESMEVEGKTRKQNEICGRFEKQQEMWQLVVFLKRNNCIGVYICTKSSSSPWLLVGFSLQERDFGPRLHCDTSLSGSFHMESTSGL